MADAAAPAGRIHSLLTPQNCTVIFIDHQPQMTFGVMSIDRQLLFNNVIGLAKAAKIFKVPVVLTTVETKGFSGYMWPQLLEIFPDHQPIERLRHALGHDHNHGLADVARLVARQQRVRAEECRTAVRRVQFHVVFGLG